MTKVEQIAKSVLSDNTNHKIDADIPTCVNYKAATSSLHFQNRVNNISYKDIKLTRHSVIRAGERLHITKKSEIRKIASRAKKNGISWRALQNDTYNEAFGMNYEEYRFLKTRFWPQHSSAQIYFYKGNVFVFVGKGKNVLKTIISLNEIDELNCEQFE